MAGGGAHPQGPPAEPSVLTISVGPATNEITLSWPVDDSWLQTAPDLVSGDWVNVTNAPAESGGQVSLTLPISQPAQFFRLVTSPNLPPPTGLVLQAALDGSGNEIFNLSWDYDEGALSYDVYFSTSPDVSQVDFTGSIDGVTNLGTTIAGLTPGITYYFVVTAVGITGGSADSETVSGVLGSIYTIGGHTAVQVMLGGVQVQLPVPGATLTLSNVTTMTSAGQTTSAGDGTFAFENEPPGTYQICWSDKGYESGCMDTFVTVTSNSVDAGQILLEPESNFGLVWGTITLADGTVPGFSLPFFQLDNEPVITLTGPGNTPPRHAIVNGQGDFVIANVAEAPGQTLAVQFQNTSFTTNIDTTVTGEADLVLPVSNPVITSLVATLNGQPVEVALPGGTVQATATAEDPNGYPLQYTWMTSDGVQLASTGPQTPWTINNDPDGFDHLLLLVSDGYGGYASARLTISTYTNVTFSGQVIGSDTGAPLANAFVSINDLETNTDANGYFAVEAPPSAEFDITITNAGYAPLSVVATTEESEETYVLQKISPAPCAYSATNLIQFTNPDGAVLTIPANSLVDQSDYPYGGCVGVAVDDTDPCTNNSFPGMIFDTFNNELTPIAYVNITVVDSNGAPLYLASGASFQLTYPGSVACPDTNFQIGFYAAPQFPSDADRWLPVTNALLELDFPGSNYTVEVEDETPGPGIPFGQFVFCDGPVAPAPMPPAVGGLQLAADLTINIPYSVIIQPATGAPVDQVITLKNNVVSGLAPGKATIKVINLRQSPGAYIDPASTNLVTALPIAVSNKMIIQVITANVLAGKTNVVAIGLGAPATNGNNLTRQGVLTVGEGKANAGFSPAAVSTLNQYFLKAVAGGKPGKLGGEKYYALADPGSNKMTFTAWQQQNGWKVTRPINPVTTNVSFKGSPDTLAGARAGDTEFGLYFNANDLGAGRRMGMNIFTDKDKNPSVAYYVATYATLGDAEKDINLKYIVCMEFSDQLKKPDGSPGGSWTDPKSTWDQKTRYIRFYAFLADGTRTSEVPDEATVPTYVPWVCMACHGGNRDCDPATNANVSAQFVPFDTANYTFSYGTNFGHQALFSGGNTNAPGGSSIVFNNLNAGLLSGQKFQQTMPPNLVATINGFIKGNSVLLSPPAGIDWGADPKNLYGNVYAVSCRSCHCNQTGSYNFGTLESFLEANSTFGIGGTPDPSNPIMPQAQRTYGIFWGSATGNKINATSVPVTQPPLLSGGTTTPVIQFP